MTTTTPISLPSGEYLLIAVPSLANELEIFSDILGNSKIMFTNPSGHRTIELIGSGNYELVGKGLASEITEDEWKGVVEKKTWYTSALSGDGAYHRAGRKTGYRNYPDKVCTLATATESGHSLIKSLHHIPDECVLVKIIQ